MKMNMSQIELASLLFKSGVAYITLPNGTTGILQSVLRESGSGHSFMATVRSGDKIDHVYISCR